MSIHRVKVIYLLGLAARKPVFGVCEQQKVQTNLRIRLHLLESIIFISQLATSGYLYTIFKLVSRAEETGLSLVLSETPKTGPEVIKLFRAQLS